MNPPNYWMLAAGTFFQPLDRHKTLTVKYIVLIGHLHFQVKAALQWRVIGTASGSTVQRLVYCGKLMTFDVL